MAEKITEYVCQACKGPLKYDATSGKMKCEYCDSTYDMEEVKNHYAAKNESNSQQAENSSKDNSWEEELGSMKAYKCDACGAELICDDTTAATSCPYCGNVAIIPQKLSGMLRPKYVIPFKVDKNEAKSKLEEYYKGKKLLPNSFTSGNHIDDIKGVYVPFWLYSGTVDAELNYDAEQVEEKKTAKEKIITTKKYDVKRKGEVSFKMIPTDASSSMPDDLMDSIEPYDYAGIKDFEMEYLAGFLADKYDVSVEDSKARARKRAENTTIDMIEDTVDNYSDVEERTGERKIKFLKESQEYAMLPVWLLSTKWNNENFLFAINGQTGNMTGNLPIDKKKQWMRILLIALPLFLIISFLGHFHTGGLVFGAIVALIAGAIANSINVDTMKPVAENTRASEYTGGSKSKVVLSVKEDKLVNTTMKKEPIED